MFIEYEWRLGQLKYSKSKWIMKPKFSHTGSRSINLGFVFCYWACILSRYFVTFVVSLLDNGSKYWYIFVSNWFYHILPVRASIVSITHPIHKFLQSLANRIQQSCFQTSNTFPPCFWTQFKWSVEFDDVRWFISQKLWISLIFHSYPPVIKHGNWTSLS